MSQQQDMFSQILCYALNAVALEAMMGRSLMNGNHMFMLGLGPIINASIMLSLLLAFKDVVPFGQQVKALQDQGAEVSFPCCCCCGCYTYPCWCWQETRADLV